VGDLVSQWGIERREGGSGVGAGRPWLHRGAGGNDREGKQEGERGGVDTTFTVGVTVCLLGVLLAAKDLWRQVVRITRALGHEAGREGNKTGEGAGGA
jgi:hypothetical protein